MRCACCYTTCRDLTDFRRNPAAWAQLGGAVFQERRTRVWGPPVAVSSPLRRVAGPAEDGAVADVAGRAACGKRHDVVDGQVTGGMGGALVARAPMPVLAPPGCACRDSPVPVGDGAADSCTVTQSPPSVRGVRVRVPSCAWVMLLTIARPRPTPAWPSRIRPVPR